MHPFDLAIQLEAGATDTFTGATSSQYANMVGPFGGITCAAMLQAVMQHAAIKGTPVAFTINYAAPVQDGPYEIKVALMRETRTTQHWFISLSQGDEVCNTATAVFAARRETWQATDRAFPAGVPGPASLERAPTAMRPTWVQRYDMRFIQGDLPAAFDGVEQPDARSVYWVKDEPARALTYPSLAAICDSFFPRVFVRRHQFMPAGTVSMTIYFHADPDALAHVGDNHVLAEARANTYQANFADQSAEVWSAQGQLLATTHQIVYFKS